MWTYMGVVLQRKNMRDRPERCHNPIFDPFILIIIVFIKKNKKK
jgi:hypothetical protein